MIKKILENDWYKTATKEEMRIALMHVQQNSMDRLFGELGEHKNQVRDKVFEDCSKYCGWDKEGK